MAECGHPDKVAYRSERAAKRAVREIENKRQAGIGFLHAYRCVGHWHIGHGDRRTTRRSNRRRRTRRKAR